MNKHIIAIAIAVIFLLTLANTAVAVGDGNIDGGGGGMGGGSSVNKWSPGKDGVRVTIVSIANNKPAFIPVDYTNITPASDIIHFGKVCKLDYRDGNTLTIKNMNYKWVTPATPIPTIINSKDKPASIEAIKRYFCSEYAAMFIAADVGISYDELIGGDYKLLLEPIGYFIFDGINYGMTATEVALYDMVLNGGLRSKLASFSHKNLPLAMFLEVSDLGYSAWKGSTTSAVSNEQIISSLGLGVVRYSDAPPEPEVTYVDYEYRTNTEVITAITLSTDRRITPDNPVSVTFNILGSTYTVTNIVIPERGSQVVWCKWLTPSTPQTVSVNVQTSGANASQSKIIANIVDLNENPPPNPAPNDRNNGYVIPPLPNQLQQSSNTWGVWSCVWGNDDWEYIWTEYTASLSATSSVMPDSKVPTAIGKMMKSGYGVNIDISAYVLSNAPSTHHTWAQNATSYFPEFHYQTYWRLHDRVVSGNPSKLSLKQNQYSAYTQRVHFLPVWFPNGTYRPYTQVIDAWTPSGMLSANVSDNVNVQGSVFDDWHISPK